MDHLGLKAKPFNLTQSLLHLGSPTACCSPYLCPSLLDLCTCTSHSHHPYCFPTANSNTSSTTQINTATSRKLPCPALRLGAVLYLFLPYHSPPGHACFYHCPYQAAGGNIRDWDSPRWDSHAWPGAWRTTAPVVGGIEGAVEVCSVEAALIKQTPGTTLLKGLCNDVLEASVGSLLSAAL